MFRKIIFVLMLSIFLFGLGLVLYPVWNGYFLDQRAEQAAQSFLSEVDTAMEETNNTDPTEETKPYQQLWDEMCAYNATLYAEKQANFDRL